VHEPGPDEAFVPGAAKRNPRAAETRAENFGFPIAVSFGADMNEP